MRVLNLLAFTASVFLVSYDFYTGTADWMTALWVLLGFDALNDILKD